VTQHVAVVQSGDKGACPELYVRRGSNRGGDAGRDQRLRESPSMAPPIHEKSAKLRWEARCSGWSPEAGLAAALPQPPLDPTFALCHAETMRIDQKAIDLTRPSTHPLRCG